MMRDLSSPSCTLLNPWTLASDLVPGARGSLPLPQPKIVHERVVPYRIDY